MDIGYREAAVEVLDILEHTKKEDVDKISKKFIDFLKEHSSKTYKSNIDHTKKIEEMNLSSKTEALLGIIYIKYWADEQDKINFLHECKERENIYQEHLKQEYSVEKLFTKKNENKNEITELPMIIEKESIIQKIINKIIRIFRRK